ncbi:Rad2 family nuclease EXO1 NDAI_0F00840 [Naumovozyma dairenensis CBS 421]|uniref:Uncharacterized protein n=1 Tax=Naumovozyma dairenensis (strain ATCC 10597 / BCRC 20456 / CBS 421 / NBRC 0211 / NRRL Y-12639) TaxID=1071378 RepID=G0WC92_NAUDC|nr:hypothetical protein NDAI_0F00840 [Naumovozyma dairenensis CBS 421]CCD25403.1 hypothetical protein NDAI_0F00840 [Naumovozyma dairenensis CBS 421]
MGIQGFLPQLKPIQNPVTLHRYEGQTLAIDGYAWLHRASCSCAYELVMNKPTAKYLQFFIKKISMLKRYNIEPYLVFDGDSVPVKKGTELKRREKRTENKTIAERLWNSGEKKNAMDYFQKCVDVTPEMAKCVIDYCKTNDIKYIVAPFEADPQMVYLEKQNEVQGIISEDSDLLIFGCRRLITKLNDYGECIEICRDDFTRLPRKFPLGQLDSEGLRTLVCLSGCDYTDGIARIGLVTAIKLVQRYKKMDRIILGIQREGKFKVCAEFIEEYRKADYAFQYQRVFCPQQKKIVSLNEIPKDLNVESLKLISQCIGCVIGLESQVKQEIVDENDIDHLLHSRLAFGELHPNDFHKRLVNREHKLQLVSKSEAQISLTGELIDSTANKENNKPIDSFFRRIEKKSSSKAKNKSLISKNQKVPLFLTQSAFNIDTRKGKEERSDINNPTKRRKLVAAPPVRILTSSRYFSRSSTETKTDTANEDEDATSEDAISTEIPESELPTEVPSSLDYITTAISLPETANQNDEPFSGKNFMEDDGKLGENDTEVLSEIEFDYEVENPNSLKDTNIVRPNVKDSFYRTSLTRNNTSPPISPFWNTLQKFRYSNSSDRPESRVPLTPRHPNRQSEMVHHSLENHVSETRNTKDVVTKPGLAISKYSEHATNHRPRSKTLVVQSGVRENTKTLDMYSSTKKQEEQKVMCTAVPAKRSVSLLSQFVYSNTKNGG